MPEPTELDRQRRAVARVLMTNTLCVECIISKTGLDVDPVLGAIAAMEADLRLIRTWGRCLSCLQGDRALLMVDVSSQSRRGSAVTYDGHERQKRLLCTKCRNPLGTAGQPVRLRRGLPYHKACAPKSR